MNAKPKKEKCIIKGCEHIQKTRGLCNNCRNAARELIKSGKTTLRELEVMGLMLPSVPNDRNRCRYKNYKNPLTLAFLKSKSNQPETQDGSKS